MREIETETDSVTYVPILILTNTICFPIIIIIIIIMWYYVLSDTKM